MVTRKNVNSNALISVYDKTSIKKICSVLKKYNIGIVSTGSTAKKITSLGYNCTEISKITKFVLQLFLDHISGVFGLSSTRSAQGKAPRAGDLVPKVLIDKGQVSGLSLLRHIAPSQRLAKRFKVASPQLSRNPRGFGLPAHGCRGPSRAGMYIRTATPRVPKGAWPPLPGSTPRGSPQFPQHRLRMCVPSPAVLASPRRIPEGFEKDA